MRTKTLLKKAIEECDINLAGDFKLDNGNVGDCYYLKKDGNTEFMILDLRQSENKPKPKHQKGRVLMSPQEWLQYTFEYEYCCECGGDAKDHEVNIFLGNYFAKCKGENKL